MRSKRMQPVARHAETIEEKAVQMFARAQQDLADMENQLQQLLSYRDEYARQLQGQGMNIQRMRDYQMFLQKINTTIDQAHVEIEKRSLIVEQKKNEWLKCRGRSKALNSVVEKYRQEERMQQERREQKEQDEHGARLAGRAQAED
ncbi:MAG: flagellar export protein FliJ [Gammaproteobacteria bacterium]|nr:MAG: flagellar export protein FliJ [Gammaproteobacteria bacterium]